MALHTDAILDAIVAVLKDNPPTGGIVSYPETFPLVPVKEAQLPALLLGLDRVEISPGEERIKGEEQHYYFDLIYLMDNGAEQYPRKAARQRAEEIVATLHADPTLGIDDFEVADSAVGMLQSDNAVQLWLMEREIKRTAVVISFEVQVSE